KEVISEFYGIEEGDADEMLEAIGRAKHKLSSGDVVNLDTTSRLVLKDWQRGKVRK
ncbi:GTP-binding protein, partial [Candidatus Woesearchaeota archaeon]|nr:GTP-binding protein [Candidatus Woesearchaeota archaeon]